MSEAATANPHQRTSNWFNDRCGKLTASNMAAAMEFLKKGGESAARRNLKIQVLAERMTGEIVPHFVTPAMQDGIDREPEAKRVYEAVTGRKVLDVGFFDHPNIENCGASPDGFINDAQAVPPDGLAEFKCPTPATHIAWLVAGVVPDEHKPQMILQMACTGRKWCDFVSYQPSFPEKQRLFVRRFTPTAAEFAAVEGAARQFLADVDAMFETVTTSVCA